MGVGGVSVADIHLLPLRFHIAMTLPRAVPFSMTGTWDADNAPRILHI
jgi:hypothetical protein